MERNPPSAYEGRHSQRRARQSHYHQNQHRGHHTDSPPLSNFRTENGNQLPAPSTYDEYKRKTQVSKKTRRFALSPDGESGRRGFHPWHFLRINFRSASRVSRLCNILWPFVPAALVVRCK